MRLSTPDKTLNSTEAQSTLVKDSSPGNTDTAKKMHNKQALLEEQNEVKVNQDLFYPGSEENDKQASQQSSEALQEEKKKKKKRKNKKKKGSDLVSLESDLIQNQSINLEGNIEDLVDEVNNVLDEDKTL